MNVSGDMTALMCFWDEKSSPLWATHFEIVQDVQITAECGYIVLPSTEGDSDVRVLASSAAAMKNFFIAECKLEPEELEEVLEAMKDWEKF